MSRELGRQAVRFLLVGGLNVAVSYGIFILLGLVVAPWIAYTAGYLAGLALVTAMTPRFVFGTGASWRRMGAFVAVYVVVYMVGRLIVALTDPVGLVELLLTSGILLAVTVPLSFLAGRLLFLRPRHRLGKVDS
ncbi:GtrA family protein [Agrococcus jenensis]|uniref:GtrA-like protein n=1 Tax=Agrococcus jenensis TaxID=46353 RepID=A0A3N2AQX9_9MICO|nr:GtrA family protein [Agrococcus jenensis]ROR65406.1 GtrA-like protein [Agrococcus jenensis]